MNAYFFLWNPRMDTESFSDLDEIIAESKRGEPYDTEWICPSRQPKRGDLAFLQRTGPKNNGVFARGVVTKKQRERDEDGEPVVELSLTSFLPLGLEISRDTIREKAKIRYNWSPMASGNIIPSEILKAIEDLWAERLPASKGKKVAKPATDGAAKTPARPKTPDNAISVRQPWAWLIVNGYKDIENRNWDTRYRGRIWIHAGVHRVTKEEYADFVEVCRDRKIKGYPGIDEFETGGIVGSVEIVDCVTKSRSYWFGGWYGFVLKDAQKSRFRPLKGQLGIFSVSRP